MCTHPRGRGERAQVVRIDVPAARRHAPFAGARECEKECADAFRLIERLAPEHGIDRRAQARTADSLKYGIGLQVLQMDRALGRPARGAIAVDTDTLERAPGCVTHRRGLRHAERRGHAHPAVNAKMLECRLFVSHERDVGRIRR